MATEASSSPLPLRELGPAPRRGPGREGPALRLLALGLDTSVWLGLQRAVDGGVSHLGGRPHASGGPECFPVSVNTCVCTQLGMCVYRSLWG